MASHARFGRTITRRLPCAAMLACVLGLAEAPIAGRRRGGFLKTVDRAGGRRGRTRVAGRRGAASGRGVQQPRGTRLTGCRRRPDGAGWPWDGIWDGINDAAALAQADLGFAMSVGTAGAAMAVSSLFVVTNSPRLGRFSSLRAADEK